MSTTIDERVVSMQFDNKHFESNVRTSLSTLEKLKQSLNLKDASKGLASINTAASKCDLAPLSRAADTVGLRFSALYTVADQAFRNMYNSAERYAKNIISAFTVDPVKTGLAEYETQIGSVQTILANTKSKGSTLDDVNAALDELNTYADKTIYNFTEMTRNIGTFTAAGVDLDKSVTSIKGIANLAAISGSTSQQASTAMYQLSQALASGTVKLMDWNSVVNAGMGGEVFQTALKRTATQMGYNVDEMIEKYGSFRESLTQGEWLTAEVLTETLTQLSGAYTKADLISQGYTEKQAQEILELAATAEGAATDVKTFTQLMDTLKESAQSGWTQTWEILIGDFESAKKLWTGVSNVFGDLINNSAEARNKLLSGALGKSTWDELVKKINEAGVETSDFEKNVIDIAKSQGINITQLIDKYGSLEEVFKSGAVSADLLKSALKGIGEAASSSDLSLVERTLKGGLKGEDVKQVEAALKSLGYNLTGKDGKDYSGDGYYGTLTEEAVKAFQKAQGLKVTGIVDDETLAKLKEATTTTKELGDEIDSLIDGVTNLGGRELLIETFKNAWSGLTKIFKSIGEAWNNVFPSMTSEQLYGIVESIHEFSKKLLVGDETAKKIRKTFEGLFSIFKIGWNAIKALGKGMVDLLGNFSGLGDSVLNVTSSIGEWLKSVSKSAEETNIFGTIIGGIVGFLGKLIGGIKSAASFIKDKIDVSGWEIFKSVLVGIWNFVSKIGSKISELGSKLGAAIGTAFKSGDLNNAMDLVNGGLFASLLLSFKKFINGLGKASDEGGILEKLTGVLDSVCDSLQTWQSSLKSGIILKIAAAIGILAVSVLLLSSIDPARLAVALGAISLLFKELMSTLSVFSKVGSIKGIFTASTAMVSISAAVLILALALKSISNLGWEGLAKGLLGVAGLMAIVVSAMKVLSTGSQGAIKGASQMVIFAAAIKILASACRDLSSLSWEQLAKGLVGVGALMTGISVFLRTAKFGGKTFSAAAGIVLLSAALKIMASVCKDFGQMKWSEIGKGLAAIGGLLLELAIFTKMTGNAKGVISTGLALVLIGGAMKIFASAVGDFSKFRWDEIGRGLAAMAGALLAVTVATRLMPKNMLGAGAGLTVASAALIILAEALTRMSGMSWAEIARGMVALGGSILILAVGLNFMTGTLAGSAALLVASAALAVMTPTLKTLGSMDLWSIIKGLLAMAGAFAVIGVAGMLLGPMVPVILGLAGAFALIGVGALALGAGLVLVGAGITAIAVAIGGGLTAIVGGITGIITGIASAIPVVVRELGKGVIEFCKVIGEGATEIGKAVKSIVLALIDVLVECVPAIAEGALQLVLGVLDALNEHAPEVVDSLFDFLISILGKLADRMPELVSAAIDVLSSLFSSIGDALMSMDSGTLAKAGIGVGIMAALMAVFSALAPLIPGAIIGVLGMGVIIAELALVMAAIGALSKIPGLTWLVGEGAELMKNLGNAIGGFVGGIVGGIAEGITDSLPAIATNLSTFMTNLDPFITGAKAIDSAALDGVKAIADIIVTLTAANILDGIAKWITGESSITKFAGQLQTFGAGLKDFATEVTGIDTAAISAAALAASTLMTTASQIPNEGGLISWIVGDNTMATFATGLKSFGIGLKDFATEVTGIDTAAITAASAAASTLISTASTIPNQGGILSWIVGDNTMATFATGLKSFGTGLKDFATEVTGIDTAAIAGAVTAANTLITTASSIPNQGGILSWIVGDNTMSTFASGLKSFGTGLKDFSTEVSGIDTASITAAANAAQTLANISISLAEGQSFMDWLTNQGDLDSFGSKMKGLGEGLSELSESISGDDFDITAVSVAVTQVSRLVTSAKTLADSEATGTLYALGSDLKQLGKGISDFYTSIEDVDASKFSAVADGLQTLASIDTTSAEAIQSFINSLAKVGSDGIDKFVSAFSDKTTEVMTAVGSMLTFVSNGVSKYTGLKEAFTTIVTDVSDAVGSATIIAKFKSAGGDLVSGFASGITANTFRATAAAAAMASAALAAAKAVLKINSPSKVFMGVGNSVPEGFAMGIDQLGGMVVGSVKSMAKNALEGTRNAISRISDVVSSDIDSQPTIRPVLDLSEVSAGASAISGMLGTPSVGVMSNLGAISAGMNRNQNGTNNDVISAIKDLGKKIGKTSGDTYQVNGVTYDDGTNIANTVGTLVRAIKVERRI